MFHLEPYIRVLPSIGIAFIIALLITPLLRVIGLKFGFCDHPPTKRNPTERGFVTRHHTKTTSRLAEFAMFIPLIVLMWYTLDLNTALFGIVVSLTMIAIFGAFDSKYNLSEFVKLYVIFFASLILIFTGVVIDVHSVIDLHAIDIVINNPITQTKLSLINTFGTLAWLYIIPTALSYVGGVDGLSEGTSAICILILLLIGIRHNDPTTITLASLALGGLLGLLPYNFHPAIIYSEHFLYGYFIAILSIISKGKIPTSLLLFTVPLVDFAYVTLWRLKKYFNENKGIDIRLILHYMGTGDRNHLHHKLMKLGHNALSISIIQYTLYGTLGLIALAVSGLYLTLAIISSLVFIVLILYYINRKINHEQSN